MTIKDILKNLSPLDKKSGKSFLKAVRECEEKQKGIFIAFVDEKENSWDLRLELKSGTAEVKSIVCDCRNRKKYCPHKIALLLYLDKGMLGNINSARKIISTRSTKADKLMSQIGDDDKILDWLRKKLNNDKVLRLAFENELIQTEKPINADFLNHQFKSTYKTVIGRKKYATAAEYPKFLDLMIPYMVAAIDSVFQDPDNKESRLLYSELMRISNLFRYLPKKPTSRTDTFFKKCITPNLKNIPSNEKHIAKLCELLLTADHESINNFDILYRVLDYYGLLLNPSKRIELYLKRLNPILDYITREKILVNYIELATKLEIFKKISPNLDLLSYQNKYNHALLEALWSNECYDKLESLCRKGLNNNSPKYQEIYFDYLMRIAHKDKSDDLLFKIIMAKLAASPEFKDYKMLYSIDLNSNQKIELAKYSEKIVLSSSYNAYFEYVQMKFFYWHHYKKYDKILDKIKDRITLMIALEYTDKLWNKDYDLYLSKAGGAFKHTDFFDDTKLREIVTKLLVAQLELLSDQERDNLSRQAKRGLQYLGIRLSN